MVAAARAAASGRPNPLIVDQYAEPLVRAVGIDFFTRLASGEMDFADIGGNTRGRLDAGHLGRANEVLRRLLSRRRIRSVHPPDGDPGVGAGFRRVPLTWPAGTTVYEIDRPEVIEFKRATLSGLGATPMTDIQTIGIDLRDDWRTALHRSGFDADKPTAWAAEGLFIGFLPGEAQAQLIRDITEISVPGRLLAADHLPGPAETLGKMMQTSR
jgi:O-methyltransferase involved in polyketide biosynthesis